MNVFYNYTGSADGKSARQVCSLCVWWDVEGCVAVSSLLLLQTTFVN